MSDIQTTDANTRRKERQRVASARWRDAHPEKAQAVRRVWRDANRERLREYDRVAGAARYASDPEKAKARSAAWREAHPERYKAVQRAWRNMRSEELRAKSAAWVAANPERVRANQRAWREANPERVRELGRKASAARRARKAGAKVVEVVDLQVLGERDGWVCGICGDRVDKSLRWPDAMSASHDHVVPLIKGGDHSYANAQLAHIVCNRRKYMSEGVA